MKVSDLIQRQSGSGATNEAFWREYARKINHAGLTAQSVVSNRFDLKLLLKFVNELPNSLAETEENSHLFGCVDARGESQARRFGSLRLHARLQLRDARMAAISTERAVVRRADSSSHAIQAFCRIRSVNSSSRRRHLTWIAC